MQRLDPLLADGVIEEVCGRLKSGKEADLWLVRQHGEIVAAKVYKARDARSFRNDAAYREGRKVRDSRTQRAMDRGSRFGRAAAEEAWKAKEADALHTLHAAGVRVPAPVLFYEGVLLMELVVDAHGRPAPRLVDAHVGRDAAAALYADLRSQAVRMLACDLIHGDLSPYNVLLGARGPVIIDFPQVVGAAHNGQAERFFQRDLENMRRFFAAIDPALHAAANDAREIWRAYERRELTADFVPSGRPAQPAHPHPRQRANPQRAHQPHAPPAPHPPGGRGTSAEQRRPELPQRRERGGPQAAPVGREPAPPRGRGPDPRGRPRGGGPPEARRAPPAPEVIRVVRLAPPRPPPGAEPHGGGPGPAAKPHGGPGAAAKPHGGPGAAAKPHAGPHHGPRRHGPRGHGRGG